jgi:hypothetical protein
VVVQVLWPLNLKLLDIPDGVLCCSQLRLNTQLIVLNEQILCFVDLAGWPHLNELNVCAADLFLVVVEMFIVCMTVLAPMQEAHIDRVKVVVNSLVGVSDAEQRGLSVNDIYVLTCFLHFFDFLG